VPLKSQLIEMGESPLMTEHCREASSPAFGISSPNENGMICGKTAKIGRIKKKTTRTKRKRIPNFNNYVRVEKGLRKLAPLITAIIII